MGYSQVTTESSMGLLVIEHLRPIGLLVELGQGVTVSVKESVLRDIHRL